MRLLVLLFAIAMPVVAYFSNTGAFGPDSATISAMYPIVLLPAGYAFMIWGLIFLLDLAFAIWALTGIRKNDPTVNRVVPWAAAGFAMTAVWMPLYSMSQLWPCVLVIFAGMACMVRCACGFFQKRLAIAVEEQQLRCDWLDRKLVIDPHKALFPHPLAPKRRYF